jgi:sporulation integral membrane protein YtvI
LGYNFNKKGNGMEKDRVVSRASRLLYIVLIFAIVYFLLEYALGILMPFIIAVIVAIPISAFSRKCSAKLGGSQKAWGIFWLAIAWGALFLCLTLAVKRLAREAGELLEFINSHSEEISEWIKGSFDNIVALPSRLPFLDGLSDSELGDKIAQTVSSMLEGLLGKISELLTSAAGKIALGTPRALVGVLVTVVSSFYICVDCNKIRSYLLGLLSDDSQKRMNNIFSQVSAQLRAYARAYLWLFVITFVELYIGFIVLGRKYAFLIAVSVAFVDILPLLGVGFVLVPWGIVLIANGSITSGVGMLILFVIVSVVRQILEPRLVGKGLGIHPLASLSAMYIGFSAFGFFGMLLAPLSVSCVARVAEQRRTKS